MQLSHPAGPEVVVEEAQPGSNLLRLVIIAVGALTLFVCACFALFLAYSQFTQNQALALANATATRTRVFAATWTPTTTDTPEPTGTPRPTSTTTQTPTDTPTETATPIEPTATRTPRAPTNTPRPRPTNTPRPKPTNTPLPPPPPTNTPTPSFSFSITSKRSYMNGGSLGVFGTVRDRNSNLVSGMWVVVQPSSGNARATSSSGGFLHGDSSRNYEISNVSGLGPGTYTVWLAHKIGNDYFQDSTGVSITITPLDSGSTQWWGIDFRQN